MIKHVLFGSWAIKFCEPLPEGANYFLVQLECDVGTQCGLLNLNSRENVARISSLGNRQISEMSALIPLALCDEGVSTVAISHLLCRAELGRFQFFKPPSPCVAGSLSLVDQVQALYRANYLQLNNYECFYQRQSLQFPIGLTSSLQAEACDTAMRYLNALRTGTLDGFRPQFGNELQHWQYSIHVTDRDDSAQVIANVCRSRVRSASRAMYSTYHYYNEPTSNTIVLTPPAMVECSDLPAADFHHGVRAHVVNSESLETGLIYQTAFTEICSVTNGSAPVTGMTIRPIRNRVPFDSDVLHVEHRQYYDAARAALFRSRIRLEHLSIELACKLRLNLHGAWS